MDSTKIPPEKTADLLATGLQLDRMDEQHGPANWLGKHAAKSCPPECPFCRVEEYDLGGEG